MEYRVAYIYFDDLFAGVLSETDEGYSFEYDTSYYEDKSRQAISLTLPKTQIKYTAKILFPFFDGLIPEGWMLEITRKNWKISSNDRFGVLLVACKDTVSRIRILGEKL